jgi:hypothetical protein
MYRQLETLAERPVGDRAAIRQTLGMRNDLLEHESLQRFVQSEMIAPHDERVDIVMLARDAAEMQIDRPPAGDKEGRAEVAERLRNLK